jgi:hypothetical protein
MRKKQRNRTRSVVQTIFSKFGRRSAGIRAKLYEIADEFKAVQYTKDALLPRRRMAHVWL